MCITPVHFSVLQGQKVNFKKGIKYTDVSGVLHECEVVLAQRCPDVVSFYSLVFRDYWTFLNTGHLNIELLFGGFLVLFFFAFQEST